MSLYSYTAKDFSGQIVEGVQESENLQNFYSSLKERGLYCIEVTEKRHSVQTIMSGNLTNKLKTKDLVIFCRQFHVLLMAGVTIIKVLDVIYQQTESKKVKAVVLKVYELVQQGDLLSDAMRKQRNIFPEILVNMVESGETSGKLELVMDRMAEHFEKEQKLHSKIVSAVTYPAILCVICVIVVGVLITFVLPTFVNMFKDSGVELPQLTQILLSVSKFLTNYWYILLLMIVILILAVNRLLKTEEGRIRFDRFILRIPVLKSTMIKIISARLARTLSTLLSSGIPLLTCLEITAKVLGNKFVSNGLLNAKENMIKGSSLSLALRKIGLFPAMLFSMISIGEESGSLEVILEKLAQYYDEETNVAITRTLAIFEPLLIVVMAAIIGLIVISIALPIFDLSSTVK